MFASFSAWLKVLGLLLLLLCRQNIVWGLVLESVAVEVRDADINDGSGARFPYQMKRLSLNSSRESSVAA